MSIFDVIVSVFVSHFARQMHSPNISFMTHKMKSRSIIIVNVMRVRTRRKRSGSDNPNVVNYEQSRYFCQPYYRFYSISPIGKCNLLCSSCKEDMLPGRSPARNTKNGGPSSFGTQKSNRIACDLPALSLRRSSSESASWPHLAVLNTGRLWKGRAPCQ